MAGGIKGAWGLLLSLISLSFAITIEEAQRMALEQFSEVRVQRIELDKKRQERLEKLGRLMPIINLEASFNIAKKQSFSFSFPSAPPQEFVFVKGSYPKFTLQFVQELFNLRNFREYRIALKSESMQRYMLKEAENKAIYTVREAYINALKAKTLLSIYKKHEELLKAHLRDVKELYKNGIVAFKDVLETEVKLYEVREKLSKSEASYKKALSYLSYVVGENVSEVEDIPLSKHELSENVSRDRLVEKLKKHRPLLKFMEGTLELSRDYVGLSRASFYPVVSFEAFYQRTEESDLFPKDRYLLSFVLRWNAFSGFRRLRALELSKLTYKESFERFKDTEKKLILELDSVLADLEATESKIELSKRQLDSAREHLRVAQEKYKAGLGTNTEVLDAQSYLITAENTLKMNTYERLLKLFKLREVVGYEF